MHKRERYCAMQESHRLAEGTAARLARSANGRSLLDSLRRSSKLAVQASDRAIRNLGYGAGPLQLAAGATVAAAASCCARSALSLYDAAALPASLPLHTCPSVPSMCSCAQWAALCRHLGGASPKLAGRRAAAMPGLRAFYKTASRHGAVLVWHPPQPRTKACAICMPHTMASHTPTASRSWRAACWSARSSMPLPTKPPRKRAPAGWGEGQQGQKRGQVGHGRHGCAQCAAKPIWMARSTSQEVSAAAASSECSTTLCCPVLTCPEGQQLS